MTIVRLVNSTAQAQIDWPVSLKTMDMASLEGTAGRRRRRRADDSTAAANRNS